MSVIVSVQSIAANTTVDLFSLLAVPAGNYEVLISSATTSNTSLVLVADALVTSGLPIRTGAAVDPFRLRTNSTLFVRNTSGAALSVAFLLTQNPDGNSDGPVSATFNY